MKIVSHPSWSNKNNSRRIKEKFSFPPSWDKDERNITLIWELNMWGHLCIFPFLLPKNQELNVARGAWVQPGGTNLHFSVSALNGHSQDDLMALTLPAAPAPHLPLTLSLQMGTVLCSLIMSMNKSRGSVVPFNCREMLGSDSSLKKAPSLKELMQKRTYEA